MMRTDPNHYRTRRIFNTVKKLWPDVIDISEVLVAHPEAIAFPTPSGVFPNLSRAWNEAEEQARILGVDEIDDLAVWAMFCAFGEMADKRFLSGIAEIFKDDIRLARFDYQMRRNLYGDKCWRLEREKYNIANTKKFSYQYSLGRKLMYSDFNPYYRK